MGPGPSVAFHADHGTFFQGKGGGFRAIDGVRSVAQERRIYARGNGSWRSSQGLPRATDPRRVGLQVHEAACRRASHGMASSAACTSTAVTLRRAGEGGLFHGPQQQAVDGSWDALSRLQEQGFGRRLKGRAVDTDFLEASLQIAAVPVHRIGSSAHSFTPRRSPKNQ